MRPTLVDIDLQALKHNARRVRALCPDQRMIAMIKADAYGVGVDVVIPALETEVDAFGVACLEEAMKVRQYTQKTCILFQGIFSASELTDVVALNLACVLHHETQLRWIQEAKIAGLLSLWIKVNTGMNRLGFEPHALPAVLNVLKACEHVSKTIGIMSHMACADDPLSLYNDQQIACFEALPCVLEGWEISRSLANSALILSRSDAHYDVVRPGLMLYGVSPFSAQCGMDWELKPVMRFMSVISVIHSYPKGRKVGYGATWETMRQSRIGVVAVGYGDGYPRHVMKDTPVWIKGHRVPIVGRISMDTLTVDLTEYPEIQIGDAVELWGPHLAVEEIAMCAGTVAYELLCQVSSRARARLHLMYTGR